MAQLPLQEHVEEISKLELLARLKAQGWKKRARIFWREVPTKEPKPTKALQLIEVSPGGSPTGYEGVINVQLGVFFPELVPLLAPWQKKVNAPKLVDCHVRAPIGLIGPWGKADHAWRIDATSDDAVLSKEVADAVEQHGLPYLESAVDMEKLGASAIPGVDGWLSVLALQRLGKKDDAKKRVDALLAAKPTDYMAIASFAGRLKLPVPPRPPKA